MQTLFIITSITLEDIVQRTSYEDGKAALLESVTRAPDMHEKVRILLERVESLASMMKIADNRLICLQNIRKVLEQATCDRSVSSNLQSDWVASIEKQLEVHSLRYEYASLYAKLVNEWLSVAKDEPESLDSLEAVGRKEMYDQREIWEKYVFEARETNAQAIHEQLHKLFDSNMDTQSAYGQSQLATKNFEKKMASETHFNARSLRWVMQGLLCSDLVTDEKRKILKDFLNSSVVLGELADVLNMRMSSLDKWQWDAAGTPVEQRRKLNGQYRFYHDEDLLQTILVRYVAVKWLTHFSDALNAFQATTGVWKASSMPVPVADRNRREFFLGETNVIPRLSRLAPLTSRMTPSWNSCNIQSRSAVEAMMTTSDDEDDSRKSSNRTAKELLQILTSEIIMQNRLGKGFSVVRSDFKWFGPFIPHSTVLAILEFFGISKIGSASSVVLLKL